MIFSIYLPTSDWIANVLGIFIALFIIFSAIYILSKTIANIPKWGKGVKVKILILTSLGGLIFGSYSFIIFFQEFMKGV